MDGRIRYRNECRYPDAAVFALIANARTSLPGLTPAIHPPQKIFFAEMDGCAGPGYAKASPGISVSGRRSFSEDGKPAHDGNRPSLQMA
jgi:hypothetical protein